MRGAGGQPQVHCVYLLWWKLSACPLPGLPFTCFHTVVSKTDTSQTRPNFAHLLQNDERDLLQHIVKKLSDQIETLTEEMFGEANGVQQSVQSLLESTNLLAHSSCLPEMSLATSYFRRPITSSGIASDSESDARPHLRYSTERVSTAERARFDAEVAQAEAEQGRIATEEEMYVV